MIPILASRFWAALLFQSKRVTGRLDMSCVWVEAPAKINLFLGVHPELDGRGYHRVDSLMCCVDVADFVEVRESTHLSVRCTPEIGIPQQSNTCWAAAQKMGQRFGRDARFSITVEKHIPDRAGLGGSSSDAAAVIVAICKLWGIDPHCDECFAVAKEVGADVPFFLEGAPTYLVGAGDEVQEVFAPIEHTHLVLIKPTRMGAGITAGEAYDEYDLRPVAPASPNTLRRLLRERRWNDLPQYIENNLEPIAERIVFELSELKMWLAHLPGVHKAMVTGSGSCIFALCENVQASTFAARAAVKRGLWAHAGTIVGYGSRILEPELLQVL